MRKIFSLIASLSAMAMAISTSSAEISYWINPNIPEHADYYAYAPATVYYGGKFHQFFCSQGWATDSTFYHPDPVGYFNRPQKDDKRDIYDQGFWDFLRYRTSGNGYTWTQPRVALTPTVTTAGKSETCTCDPAIIKHGDYWYLYYTGALKGLQTVVYVARSKTLNGKFLRYTKRKTWEEFPSDPEPILKPKKSVKGSYGLGQLSVVKRGNTFHFWFNYVLDGKPQNFMHMTSSSPYDSLQYRTWTAISLDGKKNFANNFDSNGVRNTSKPNEFNDFGDVKWNSSTKKYEMWTTSAYADSDKGKNNYLVKYESSDGNTWNKKQELGPYNFIHNVGVSGDSIGWVDGRYIITFAAPTNSRQAPKASSYKKPFSLFQVMVGDNQTSTLAITNGFQIPISSKNLEAVSGDFDGDGIADLAVVNRSDSRWYIYSSLTGLKGVKKVPWGSKWKTITSKHTILTADYDGDGKTDLALVDKSSGKWSIRSSKTDTTFKLAGKTFVSDLVIDSNMKSSSILLTGDYDGDGKADIGFVNPSSGKWYIKSSATGKYLKNGTKWNDMTSDHIPVEGDFDGDGITDVARYSKSKGQWSITSSRSSDFLNYYHSQTKYISYQNFIWGGSSYKPVVGNYDQDGKDDLSVVSISEKAWIHFDWRQNVKTISFPEMNSNSQFLVGDYDGDGIKDEAIFNKSDRKFYIHSSRNILSTSADGVNSVKVMNLFSYDKRNYLARQSSAKQEEAEPAVFTQAERLKVASNHMDINVSGLIPGQKVFIYNMKGQKLLEQFITSPDMTFTMPATGLYILMSDARMVNFTIK